MLHVKKKSNNNSTPPNPPAVTSEETGTGAVSGAGDAGRWGATDSGKKNVCLRIVPIVVKGMGQHNNRRAFCMRMRESAERQ